MNDQDEQSNCHRNLANSIAGDLLESKLTQVFPTVGPRTGWVFKRSWVQVSRPQKQEAY